MADTDYRPIIGAPLFIIITIYYLLLLLLLIVICRVFRDGDEWRSDTSELHTAEAAERLAQDLA